MLIREVEVGDSPPMGSQKSEKETTPYANKGPESNQQNLTKTNDESALESGCSHDNKPPPIFKRSMSILVAGPNISRKAKQDLIDEKIVEFENVVTELEEHLRNIQFQLDQKCDKDYAEIIREDKISKEEIQIHLPDYLQVDDLQSMIGKIVDVKNTDTAQ